MYLHIKQFFLNLLNNFTEKSCSSMGVLMIKLFYGYKVHQYIIH